MTRRVAVALLLAASLAMTAAPDELVDYAMMTRIREEGFSGSKVMDTLFQLTDVIGARLTGSPNLKRANQWTREQLASWGLANAHLESWGPFGRGWSFDRSSLDARLELVKNRSDGQIAPCFRRGRRRSSRTPRPGRRAPTAPCAARR